MKRKNEGDHEIKMQGKNKSRKKNENKKQNKRKLKKEFSNPIKKIKLEEKKTINVKTKTKKKERINIAVKRKNHDSKISFVKKLSEEKNEKKNKDIRSTKYSSIFNSSKLKRLLHESFQSTSTFASRPHPVSPKVSSSSSPSSSSSLSLKEKMLAKLESSRFRHLNERLYSMDSREAFKLFEKDEEAFHVYHRGFSGQVSKWPLNPVQLMIEYIKQRPPNLVVADLGCGEAKISQSVPNKVHSFDLVPLNHHVIVADISKVPLATKSVDIGVFCLSLMGTNIIDLLKEASRILKINGILLVAEVVSRFEKFGIFIKKMNSIGFKIIKKDAKNKMFIWMEFKKMNDIPNKEKLPQFSLAPCLYKKR